MLPRQWSHVLSEKSGLSCDDCEKTCSMQVQFIATSGGSVLTMRFPAGWVCGDREGPRGSFLYCPECTRRHDNA